MMKESNPEAEMGFFEHIEVLRWHLLRSAVALLLGATVVGLNYAFFFDNVLMGVCSKDFLTYRVICRLGDWLQLREAICIEKDIPLVLQNLSMFGQVTLLFQYCFVFGFVLAFPYILYELWRFIAPAMSEETQKKTGRVILISSVFFMTGVLFCYYVIIPFSIHFAVDFSLSAKILNQFTIESYIDFFTVMLLGMGIVFEMPMIVYILSRIGILSAESMRGFRRVAVLIILIAAAFITPSPDIFTQCLVALPLYVLFELSILIAARNNRLNANP